ncbi:MarR family winged helix-turn-helix transcriptional regulator [Alkaliphilus crotonatoxidans]
MKREANEVINSFIQLTEKIANGKTNVLELGEEMIFYRGEIHMLKLVGDQPGIYISEMARSFNITRAVVAKTVGKLAKRGMLTKEEDPHDKKRLKLFLTEKGQEAYRLHHEYHQSQDQAMFDFLDDLSNKELSVLKEFLGHAHQLIQNHF